MLSNLNENQKKAVLNTENQMLILAGAGSGKTRVLTTKIAHLIQDKNIDEKRILAITFTNKAASEMKERVAELLPNINVDNLWIGTFHSICARILRRGIEKIGYNSSFTIYDRDDQRSLIREILKDKNITEESLGTNINSLINGISSHKNKRISPEDIIKTNPSFGFMKALAFIYPLYEKVLKQNNALDFDDLILKTLELLEKDKETRDYYSDRFLYIFVDEYQDTNKMQYDLIKLLSKKHKNLSVVGDIDQSIYKFRGADINNILDFEKDFPNAKLIKLEQNYRSTENILSLANKVIDHNIERKEKKLWTDNKGGAPVYYHLCQSSDEEAKEVVDIIEKKRNEGKALNEMAILYRTNAQSRSFEDRLRRSNIPYRLIGGLKFYDRKEIKDILAYIKMIVNPADDISLLRIINTPRRGIGDTTLGRVSAYANSFDMSLYDGVKDAPMIDGIGPGIAKRLKDFVDMMEDFNAKAEELKLTDLVYYIIKKSGYEEMLINSKDIQDKTRLENIEEFVSSVAEYEEENPMNTLWDYCQEISLLSDVDKTAGEEDGVSMMTIHSAKGTEYDIVFVTGMEEGLFPSARSVQEGEIEEERRLCYVALTRARKELFITGARSRRKYGEYQLMRESTFINEMGDFIEKVEGERDDRTPTFSRGGYKIPQDSNNRRDPHAERLAERFRQKRKEKIINGDNFATGDKVLHPIWGEGMIVMAKEQAGGDQMLTISFPDEGIKKVLKSFAKLERKS